VPSHHFISYSRIEAKDFALRLGDDLAIGVPLPGSMFETFQPAWIGMRPLRRRRPLSRG
jgi:hypothetical protein